MYDSGKPTLLVKKRDGPTCDAGEDAWQLNMYQDFIGFCYEYDSTNNTDAGMGMDIDADADTAVSTGAATGTAAALKLNPLYCDVSA